MIPCDYLDAVRGVLNHLERTQLPAIERAADLAIAALTQGGMVRCAAIGHGNEQDFLNRAGGLAALQPFSAALTINDPAPDCLKNRTASPPVDKDLETIRLAVRAGNLRAGDVILVGSVSGRSRGPVELALACQAAGVKVIALTSLAYSARAIPQHPSGNKLAEVADVVIDNGAPYGDAAVAIPGMPEKALPVSGVAMIVAGWMIWGRVMEKMAAAGNPPTTYISVNRDDGQAHYARSRAQVNRRGY
jgi:uncharacterized phosphosugar-binding protein